MDIRDHQRVGIVGSRQRTDRESVEAFVRSLPTGCVVVSGGARGVDTWAVEAARARGLEVREHLPDLSGVKNRHEATRRYYARNEIVANDCDMLVAFVATDRRGGTEDTIRRAEAAGKPVVIM
jgi:predicted Rossmann fold nucleotide-binding protein DprA/Smf involved in DNA uptake